MRRRNTLSIAPYELILADREAIYFSREDWTRFSSRAPDGQITSPVSAFVHTRLHAGMGAGCVSPLENGLNVIAIRNAPSPTAQEPI